MTTEWRVLKNETIEKLEENLWAVEGSLPRDPPFRRRMVMIKLRDGRLVIHNAICLSPEAMTEVEAWGEPAWLIVPGSRHRLDAPMWKARFPKMKVVCPSGARKIVEKVVPVDTCEPDFGDPDVRWLPIAGVGDGEIALAVTSGDHVTMVLNDVVMNMRPGSGFMGFMFGLFGFTGDRAKVSGPTKMALMKDKRALGECLVKLADTPKLSRVIVSHGAHIDADALRTAGGSI
jgi:hypothetical protein